MTSWTPVRGPAAGASIGDSIGVGERHVYRGIEEALQPGEGNIA